MLKKELGGRKLKADDRLESRIGYMGSGFVIAVQWTIQPELYGIGFICVVVKTSYRNQWNLVALNMNGLIAWITHLLT